MDLIQYIRNKLAEEHLVFIFRGEINSANSIALLTLLEKEMENAEYGFRARKRLFMFVLESLQNISRHGEHNHHADMSLVVYSKTDNGYTITTGNVVSEEVAENLGNRLGKINKLKTEEIKELYRQVLCSAEFSNKGGAGLGLLEMANKTGNRLDYDFVPVSDDFSYFILSKTADNEGMGVHHPGEETTYFDGSTATDLGRLMEENNIYMIWSGHINSDVEEEVLSLAETKFEEENVESALKRRVFSILVEILENVALYTPGAEAEKKYGMPLAMIRYEYHTFILTTGNIIFNSEVNELRAKLDSINMSDNAGLKDLYVQSLSGQTIDTDSTGNLGLIEIARKSGKRLEYRFEKINESYSYYTLTVQVEAQQY